jgi:hypothetical protein
LDVNANKPSFVLTYNLPPTTENREGKAGVARGNEEEEDIGKKGIKGN